MSNNYIPNFNSLKELKAEQERIKTEIHTTRYAFRKLASQGPETIFNGVKFYVLNVAKEAILKFFQTKLRLPFFNRP